MDRRKEDAVLHVSSRARSENGGGETFQRLALRRSGSMDWCGEGIERRMFHGCFARIRKRSRALRLKKERVGECQGESRTPDQPRKLSGLLLLLQMVNRDGRIFLALQKTLHSSGFELRG